MKIMNLSLSALTIFPFFAFAEQETRGNEIRIVDLKSQSPKIEAGTREDKPRSFKIRDERQQQQIKYTNPKSFTGTGRQNVESPKRLSARRPIFTRRYPRDPADQYNAAPSPLTRSGEADLRRRCSSVKDADILSQCLPFFFENFDFTLGGRMKLGTATSCQIAGGSDLDFNLCLSKEPGVKSNDGPGAGFRAKKFTREDEGNLHPEATSSIAR